MGLTPPDRARAPVAPWERSTAAGGGTDAEGLPFMPVFRRTFVRMVSRTASDALARVSITRSGIILSAICVMFLALIGRVAYLQTYGRQQTIRRADRQQHQREILPARRGSIFDRNGIELAGTIQTRACFVDPKFMQDVYQQDRHSLVEMDAAIAKLAKVLEKDSFELSQLLSDRFDSRFVKVAENLDDETCDRVKRLNLPGVGIAPSDVRYYPTGSLAAHILGGCGKDGHGLDGLEMKFEQKLAGREGYVRSTKDAAHRPINVAAEDYLPPQHGQHLMLTIDANIQMIAEQELARTCREFHAARGEVVVMDPRSGEVLALANYPTFNPQEHDAPPDARRNNCLVAPYEPGSTIKPFVAGPALKWRVTRVNEIWPIPGLKYKTPYGRTITDVHGYPPLAMWDVLVKSSNIGMAMLGERMGNPKLYEALSGWGFGRPTGIELPGENGGRLNPLREWTKYSTESVAQGYEVMVTPLQLARGFCAYANGGKLVQPTLIRGTLDPEGHTVSRHKPGDLDMMPEVIDPTTAAEMKRVLSDVVVRGTASSARSDTWNVFGKTGTAHISEGKHGYSATRYNSSFICGAPAEDPRIVAAFIIHEPDKSLAHYGGAVAAPGAVKMLERTLAYLQVPPSPELVPPPPSIAKVLYAFDPKVYKQKPKREMADLR
jgi:cell division protein FtsI (penicillin-binding protein 3)